MNYESLCKDMALTRTQQQSVAAEPTQTDIPVRIPRTPPSVTRTTPVGHLKIVAGRKKTALGRRLGDAIASVAT